MANIEENKNNYFLAVFCSFFRMPNLRNRLVYTEFLVDWFTVSYNTVARHFGTEPFRPMMFRYVEAISLQTFCYTKVMVGPKTIRPQDVSALHVSWIFQAEGHLSPLKDVLHQTISAPIHSGIITSWPFFSESFGRAG